MSNTLWAAEATLGSASWPIHMLFCFLAVVVEVRYTRVLASSPTCLVFAAHISRNSTLLHRRCGVWDKRQCYFTAVWCPMRAGAPLCTLSVAATKGKNSGPGGHRSFLRFSLRLLPSAPQNCPDLGFRLAFQRPEFKHIRNQSLF